MFAEVANTGRKIALLSWHHLVSVRPALGLIAVLIGIPLIGAILVTLMSGAGRRLLRRRRRPKAELLDAAVVEAQLRAMMSELCPHGWRAHVTVFGRDDELPADAPPGERSRVALDWAELEDGGDHEAIVRRVWAPTVVEALEAMVSDRRTDETLERIERAAMWPD